MSRVRVGKPPTDMWRCTHCGYQGTWDETVANLCEADLPPCRYCKQTPECAIDCPGILALLGSPDVNVVTDDPKMRAMIDRARKGRGST